MKKRRLLIIIIASILLTGCFSYLDINRVFFSTFSIHDKGEEGSVDLYGEYFTSDRGDSEQGGVVIRVVLKGNGKNAYEAFDNLQGSSTYPIRYDLLRAIGFTEDLARDGIEESLDFLERDQNVTNKIFLFITPVDPEKLLNVKMDDEKYLGIWLEDLFIFQEQQSKVLSIRSNDYLNERLKGSRISALPIVDIIKMPTEERLYISGAAIMEDNKMVGKLSKEDIPLYKILFRKDRDMIGSFGIKDPNTGANVAVSLIPMKIAERIEVIDGVLTLIYDITAGCSIQSVVGELNLLDSAIRSGLIKATEETISKRSEDFYKKYQEEGIDILDVRLKLTREYPHMEFDEDIFRSVDIKVHTTIKLDGSQNTTKTLE